MHNTHATIDNTPTLWGTVVCTHTGCVVVCGPALRVDRVACVSWRSHTLPDGMVLFTISQLLHQTMVCGVVSCGYYVPSYVTTNLAVVCIHV